LRHYLNGAQGVSIHYLLALQIKPSYIERMKQKPAQPDGEHIPADYRQDCQIQIRCSGKFKAAAKAKAKAAGLGLSEWVKRLVVGA